jgi:hypothetical protein
MATLQEQLTKAKKIQPDKLKNDLFKFIKSIEKEFLDKNREQIQEDSKDIFGKPIGFYSYGSELASGGKKKKGDPFSGFDTGYWLKGFQMQEVSGVLRFTSTDEKNQLILKSDNWLSDELFGLSDENLKEVIETRLLPFFIENIRNKLDI